MKLKWENILDSPIPLPWGFSLKICPVSYLYDNFHHLEFFDEYEYIIGAAAIIFLFLIFVACLYFTILKTRPKKQQAELVRLIEEQKEDESDHEVQRLIEFEVEEAPEYDALQERLESPQDIHSFTSDEDILSYKDRKRFKKKKRHSLFPFAISHLKSKEVSEKSSLMDLSETSSDTYCASETCSIASTDESHYRYQSRSMESILSAISHGTETFGEDLSTCSLHIYAKYNPDTWVLSVGCRQAECSLTTEEKTSYWKVHITLLPFKKRKFKTATKPSLSPAFNQTFEVHNIARPVLAQISVRYRLYGRISKTGPKKMAGEINVSLAPILYDDDYEINEWRELPLSNAVLKKTKKRKFLSTND